MENLRELFLDELADLYHAENQLLKALPKMAKAASAPELKEAFESHLEETEGHVERLEQVFELFDKPAKGKKCEAMEGLIQEGKNLMEEDAPESVMDAGLICAAQKVEHYEIASYGCLCTWAEVLEENEAVDLLKETLDEEKDANEKLTDIAENHINFEAKEGEDESEDSDKSSSNRLANQQSAPKRSRPAASGKK